MKRFILFTFSILLTFTFAIAQDGINYQGAATDANGDELTNQSISIRASVLSGGANGNLEWEETHSATTDQFGLFNVVVGQGTNTTNGATATFDDMDWGSGNHYLKIEMDATGGTNYAMIGTTQMMSVPYALYAKSAGIDSTMLANMIGSSSGGIGGGCDLKFPEGLDGEIINIQQTNNYQVPSGKRLYVTHIVNSLSIDGVIIYGSHNSGHGFRNISNPIIIEENQVLASPINGGYINLNGILINANQDLLPITVDYNNYQVPASKKLIVNYVRRGTGSFGYGNTSLELAQKLFMPIIINQGTLIQTSNGSFNGYLVDENYFANCGGGGSSSSASAVDSAMVAGMIASSGVGGSFGDWELIYEDLVFPGTQSTVNIKWGQASKDGFLYLMDKNGGLGTIYTFTDENILDTIPGDGMLMSKRHDFRRANTGYYETKLIPIQENSYWVMQIPGSHALDLYFIPNSGGGSSSSASAVDSAMVAGMIAAALPTPAAQIGEFRDGGVVFWVDGSGQHGLVCDIQDLGTAEWGCDGTFGVCCYGTGIGIGQQNTIDILNECSTAGIAADLCANSTAQGYSDWFLPSKDALYELYTKAYDINFTLVMNGGSGFGNNVYWSSSKIDHNYAQELNFSNGAHGSSSRYVTYNVRAVRAF